MYTKEQLAELSGDNTYKTQGGLYYDTIVLGTDGKFYINYYSQPKDERPEPKMIGEELTVTILKIRRKLARWENKVNTLDSVEYDNIRDNIYTSEGVMTEKEARSNNAKVSLVLYLLVKDRIVKLTVSGGSLYNPDDKADMRLYSYLSSFEENEHSFMFETVIGAKQVEFEDKTFYQLTFKRGGEHSDLEVIGEYIVSLTEELKENDERDAKFIGGKKTEEKETTDEINPEDIPF